MHRELCRTLRDSWARTGARRARATVIVGLLATLWATSVGLAQLPPERGEVRTPRISEDGATARTPSVPPTASAVGTIELAEIERGQKGYGFTVFAGTEPERFELEVVGVVRNMSPGVSFILAELDGHGLQESGVAGGMSGSPVYIDDRLAGAVSFSWTFSNGALAGITPIATMRTLHSEISDSAVASGDSSPVGVIAPWRPAREASLEALLQRGDGAKRFRTALAALLSVVEPASVGLEGVRHGHQLLLSGFTGSAASLLESELGRRGVASVGSGRADESLEIPPLGPGSTVVGVLVGGDLQMAVSGTVTDRRDDEILAFGHPFLGVGPLNVPMAKGEVVTVVSSKASSFKLTNSADVVGAFEQDRLPGIRGRVGAVAPTTPMSITIRGEQLGETEERTYALEFADLPAMRPGLIGVSLLQALEAAERTAGEQSVEMRAVVDVAGFDPLVIEQSFDGTGATFDAAVYMLQVFGFLELNPWRDVDIEAIDVAFDVFETQRQQRLVDAFPARRVVRPGEELEIHLELEEARGGERSRDGVTTTLPDDLEAGPYYLFVGDGVSADAVAMRIAPRAPDTFDETLDVLRSFRSTRDLIVLGTRAGRGLTFEGRPLADLPASVRALWQTARRTEIKRTSLVIEQQDAHRRERPLSGMVRIDLVVADFDHSEESDDLDDVNDSHGESPRDADVGSGEEEDG